MHDYEKIYISCKYICARNIYEEGFKKLIPTDQITNPLTSEVKWMPGELMTPNGTEMITVSAIQGPRYRQLNIV